MLHIARTSGVAAVLAAMLGAVLSALGAAAPAAAQQASFDCLKAQTPIEHLICSDPRLLTLDGDLGQAFRAARQRAAAGHRDALLGEQRAWLEERLSRCGVPAKGADDIPDELRWRAAPCLADLYQARLAALGAPAEPLPAPPPAASEPGFIHPACLWPLVEQEQEAAGKEEGVPLQACARGSRHIPVSVDQIGAISAPGASDGFLTWLSYREVGALPDGRQVVVVRYNSGGTGVFSEIYLLRQAPSAGGRDTVLSGTLVAGGGDRCNGGIAQARLADPRTIEVDYQVTPQDLLSEADEQAAVSIVGGLPSCALCCTGTIRRRLDIASKQEQTISATVDQLLSAEAGGSDADPMQACFDDLIRKQAPSLPHTFSPDALRALAAAFSKQCGGRK